MSNISNNSIFVAISFHKKYKNILHTAIIPAIEAIGFKPAMSNDIYGKTNDIYKDIGKQIYASSILIADVSKKEDDDGDPIDLSNVFYEIGLAHAINKNVILLCRKGKEKIDMPYDLDRIRHLSYDPDNLSQLKEDLQEKISRIDDIKHISFFDDLKIMTDQDKEDLEYLKKRADEITIKVYPPTADIFFNDKLLGQSPQTIYINSWYPRNTLSLVAPGYFEFHKVLMPEYIKNIIHNHGSFLKIELELEPFKAGEIEKRVPSWLRDRRIDSDNPVLMRAIGQYLIRLSTKQDNYDEKKAIIEEAKKELEELIKIAPHWYLAHNQLGVLYKENYEQSMTHYKMATLLNPKSYLGYYNQACSYSRNKDFDKVIKVLNDFNNDEIIESYSYSSLNLNKDEAFDNIKDDINYKIKFEELVELINLKANTLKEKREND